VLPVLSEIGEPQRGRGMILALSSERNGDEDEYRDYIGKHLEYLLHAP
jgi:hypothetical protein